MDNLLLCEDCGWTGEEGDCKAVNKGGVRVDTYYLLCPKCDSENLIELTGKGARLEPVLVG